MDRGVLVEVLIEDYGIVLDQARVAEGGGVGGHDGDLGELDVLGSHTLDKEPVLVNAVILPGEQDRACGLGLGRDCLSAYACSAGADYEGT